MLFGCSYFIALDPAALIHMALELLVDYVAMPGPRCGENLGREGGLHCIRVGNRKASCIPFAGATGKPSTF